MICRERQNLYWFTPNGQIGRVTTRSVFRNPIAMCQGPGSSVYVMDLPVWTKDGIVLWQVDRSGNARSLGRWVNDLETPGPLSRPTQITCRDGVLYIADQIKGLLAYQASGQLKVIVQPQSGIGRYGGVAFDASGDLLLAHGFYHKTSGDYRAMSVATFPAGLLRVPANGQPPAYLASDQGGALWFPRAIAIAGGTIYMTDQGKRAETVAYGWDASYGPGVWQNPSGWETSSHEVGCLQQVKGNHIVRLRISVAGRPLLAPWGLSLDRDGSLLIADPAMADESGKINGAVVRYTPDAGAIYLLGGKDTYQPVGVLPRQ